MRLSQKILVIGIHHAGIDTAKTFGQRVARISRIFDGLPRLFEEETLLRVHHRRLTRRDAEEEWIKALHIIQETPAKTQSPRVRSEIGQVPVTAALYRNFRYGTDPGRKILPKLLRVVRTGKPAGKADDGNRPIGHSGRNG